MIPPFDASGKLPPGVHWASWAELTRRFGRNVHRRRLLDGLRRALDELTAAGCQAVYVDGSFVTRTPKPRDFDMCWDEEETRTERLEPALLAYAGDRFDQRATFEGDIFPCGALADPYGATFVDFFQADKLTGRPKGIVAIGLGDAP